MHWQSSRSSAILRAMFLAVPRKNEKNLLGGAVFVMQDVRIFIFFENAGNMLQKKKDIELGSMPITACYLEAV